MGNFPSPRSDKALIKHFSVELVFVMEKALVCFNLVTLFLLPDRKRVFLFFVFFFALFKSQVGFLEVKTMKLWGPLARAAAPGASHSHAGPQSGFCSSLKLPFQCSHQFTGAPVHAAPAAWLQACRPLCDPPGETPLCLCLPLLT